MDAPALERWVASIVALCLGVALGVGVTCGVVWLLT
jgi:hypothetical protein